MQFDFDGAVLGRAIRATFNRRGTAIPLQPPVALTPEFSRDVSKATQWRAFVSRGRLMAQPPMFGAMVEMVAAFIWPVVEALSAGERFAKKWSPGGPWQ